MPDGTHAGGITGTPDPSSGKDAATGMTLAAVVLGLAMTETLSASDQNTVANLLFAAAQAISTRASLLPADTGA